jgi:hypothetical protein
MVHPGKICPLGAFNSLSSYTDFCAFSMDESQSHADIKFLGMSHAVCWILTICFHPIGNAKKWTLLRGAWLFGTSSSSHDTHMCTGHISGRRSPTIILYTTISSYSREIPLITDQRRNIDAAKWKNNWHSLVSNPHGCLLVPNVALSLPTILKMLWPTWAFSARRNLSTTRAL